MNVIGYTESGMIHIEVYGLEMFVPDDLENRYRQMVAEWEAEGNAIPPYERPTEPEPVTILYPVDLWSRLTDVEADQVEAAMRTQPARVQNIFRAASSYRSDHELWPLLEIMAIELFGPERAAEILAPSGRS